LNKISEFQQAILDSALIKGGLIKQEVCIKKIIKIITKSIKKGGKVLLCGNGGSAADAQHLAAEFTVRLRSNFNREAIPAVCLSADIPTITACANDYGFKMIFLRNLQALYKKNDILIVLSTSGNSDNIIEVLKYCKKNFIPSIGFLGSSGGKAKKICDSSIVVDSHATGRIQEMHIFLGHFIFEKVEDLLFRKITIKKNGK
jgi:D-sedoheptulose 7-phosphate isomerase